MSRVWLRSSSRSSRSGRLWRRSVPGGEVVLDQAETEVVAGALGQHLAREQPSRRAHAAGQVAQPQAEARRVEIRGGGPAQEGVQLAQPPILSAVVAEV